MLAEAIHSFADILNQLLLRAGVQLSRKPATRQHPYGFHKEKYIFSLMSAVGIFCIGAGASVLHGVQSIFDPPQLTNMAVSFKVIIASGLLEFYSLRVAYHAIRVGAAKEGQPFWSYIMRGRDPTTAAVFAEDAGAVAGLGIAGMSTYLTHLTGNALYDSVGSISVGLLMGGIAITLIRNNKRFLIGQSMPPEMHEKVVSHLKADPMVVCVVDPKSEEMGDGVYRFKAEIQWSGDCVVKKYLAGMGRQTAYEEIEKLAQLASNSMSVEQKRQAQAAMDGKMFEFGRGVITTIGGEIDRLEIELKGLVPGLVYCDLETDKGRAEEVVMSSLDLDLNESEKKMGSSKGGGGGEGLGGGDDGDAQQRQEREEASSSS
jgi:solute carrier family 30 (zinc transporter), member 9